MNVKNVVTLGIGAAPGDIRYFVLTGLTVGALPAPLRRSFPVSIEDRVLSADGETRTLPVRQEARTLDVKR